MTSNNMLFDQLFAAHQDSEKIFLHTVQTDYSYAQFHQLVNQLANALLQTGLKTVTGWPYRLQNLLHSLRSMLPP